MRTAVYCGTQNVYGDMVTACKSLLANAEVDRVFFLIEDPVFPEALPDCITCLDVSGQRWFGPEGPNYHRRWTWMNLVRLALAKILPEDVDAVLSLDNDTVVVGDISPLWDIDLGDSWYAAVREPVKTVKRGELYCNAGVALHNLRQIRADGAADRFIEAANQTWYECPEQDVLNPLSQGRILELPRIYNCCPWTMPLGWEEKQTDVRILHHAAANYDWRATTEVRRYREMRWEDVVRR